MTPEQVVERHVILMDKLLIGFTVFNSIGILLLIYLFWKRNNK